MKTAQMFFQDCVAPSESAIELTQTSNVLCKRVNLQIEFLLVVGRAMWSMSRGVNVVHVRMLHQSQCALFLKSNQIAC